MLKAEDWLRPDWTSVRACQTGLGFNLGWRQGDVRANQAALAAHLGAPPVFLSQVHGTQVVRLQPSLLTEPRPEADAAVCTDPGLAVAILVADCLPVLFKAPGGVAGAHAGWRGLAAGVLENTVQALCEAAACEPPEIEAWLGASIGPQAFEVGAEVVQAFGREAVARDQTAFAYQPNAAGEPRWRADLYALARERLAAAGVRAVSGGGHCTLTESSRFYSFRGEALARPAGRMAACIRLLA